jgi:hypothetical protein
MSLLLLTVGQYAVILFQTEQLCCDAKKLAGTVALVSAGCSDITG